MLFYEPLFLLVFLPIVYGVFLLLHRRPGGRLWVLLPASVFFYLWSEPRFVPVVLASCALDYAIGRRLEGPGARGLLALGVCANAGILVFYKYTGFLVDNLDVLLGSVGLAPIHAGRIALPIGVSFIVFEKITYLVDIHRRRSRPAPDFPTYLLYVFLFPKLLAGPIIKYHELDEQLLAPDHTRFDDMATGFRRFMLGAVKKTLLADTLSTGADAVFAVPAGSLGFGEAWWGVALFTLQIYLDFSAYSDMAIGLARMFGFRLRENFNMPYISCSITEFWRRWHISLSTWIREYLYIPLGGNRAAPWRVYANLWVCFLASGLWHGAAWTYVVWGAYNGLFLVLDRLFLLRVLDRLPRVLANGVTLLVVMAGWAIFRAGSLGQAGLLLSAMLHPGLAGTMAPWRTPDVTTAAVVAGAISLLPRAPGFERARLAVLAWPPGLLIVRLAVALLFVLAVMKALADPFKPFLYFRF
jgi:alginate O-acetyltransferase complex protein AlgI